jgi:HEAT repeat protein
VGLKKRTSFKKSKENGIFTMYRRTDAPWFQILIIAVVFSLLLLLGQHLFASEDPLSLEQLIEELAHPDPNRCWAAIEALGASGDKRAVSPLMTALGKDMRQRRGFAMAIIPALGQLGDERAVPLLLKALNNMDEDWLGREAAAMALGEIGATKAVPSLIRAAWLPETREVAVEALVTIGDPRAVDVLISALDDQETLEVREIAISGLIQIGEPAVPALIDMIKSHRKEYPKDHKRALAVMILGKIGDQRAVDQITKALDDPSAEVRKSAVSALEYIKH